MKFEHEKNKAKESQLLLTHLQQQVQRQEDEIAAYREYHEALSPEYLKFRLKSGKPDRLRPFQLTSAEFTHQQGF